MWERSSCRQSVLLIHTSISMHAPLHETLSNLLMCKVRISSDVQTYPLPSSFNICMYKSLCVPSLQSVSHEPSSASYQSFLPKFFETMHIRGR